MDSLLRCRQDRWKRGRDGMKTEFTRFDMKRPPKPTKWYLQPLEWALSMPATIRHRTVIRKYGTEDLKPPYLLLCNHNAFMEFKVATRAIFPHRANYVVAIDGFIGREELLRSIGCICKRKFTNEITLIRQLKRVVQNGNIAVLYPEARYSLCGTTAVLPASLGKLCKMLGVPVAVLICHGHHINSPFWNLHERGVAPTEAEFIRLYTAEELADATADEVNEMIVTAFQYDDFAWQKNRNIRTTYPKRAEGLHKVLYQCPSCGTEYRMSTEGTQIRCGACAQRAFMRIQAQGARRRFGGAAYGFVHRHGSVLTQVAHGFVEPEDTAGNGPVGQTAFGTADGDRLPAEVVLSIWHAACARAVTDEQKLFILERIKQRKEHGRHMETVSDQFTRRV